MFIYSFTKYAWHDRVFLRPNAPKCKAGDLLQCGEGYLLVLGDKISFQEKYNNQRVSNNKSEPLYSSLLTPHSMELLHRIVANYYSTYKACVKYFVSQDLDKLLQREIKVKKKDVTDQAQELYLFPDLWTLMNTVDEEVLNAPNNIFLNSKMSPKQKDLAWRKIKTGVMHKIFCTHGNMFQDWRNLKKVNIYEPHKWYYKSQRDPRYYVPTVVEEMRKVYNRLNSLTFIVI